MGNRVQSSRREISHWCGTRPGVESPGSRPFAAIPGGHLQLVAVGFHPGLRVSAHRCLSATTALEKQVHPSFGLGPLESAPRPDLCPWHAESADTEYRRLRGAGPRGREHIETAA